MTECNHCGDQWSLIVLRDVIFGGRRHFRELLSHSEEGIASNILSSRLKALVAAWSPHAGADRTRTPSGLQPHRSGHPDSPHYGRAGLLGNAAPPDHARTQRPRSPLGGRRSASLGGPHGRTPRGAPGYSPPEPQPPPGLRTPSGSLRAGTHRGALTHLSGFYIKIAWSTGPPPIPIFPRGRPDYGLQSPRGQAAGHGRRRGRSSQRWVVHACRIRLRTVMIESARSEKVSMTVVRRS